MRYYKPTDQDHNRSHSYASIHRQLAEENLLAKIARDSSKQQRKAAESLAFWEKGE